MKIKNNETVFVVLRFTVYFPSLIFLMFRENPN
jgi:hypothetical protein